MRHAYFILALLVPLQAFSIPDPSLDSRVFAKPLVYKKNSIIKSYTNEWQDNQPQMLDKRNADYPTQIIRMSYSLEGQQLTCTQVLQKIEESIIQHITPDKFTYNTYIVCNFDLETHLATYLIINSYFDPLNDSAIEFLNAYLAKYNGSDFLGSQLNIESARGLVIALNLIAGIKKNPASPLFLEYRQDRSNFYFKNNLEMKKQFFSDVYANFFSNDPDKILPFLSKWFFPSAGSVYKSILKDSNYVELQPERIFLMNDGEEIFVSELKYYFAHHCKRYENHRCLEKTMH